MLLLAACAGGSDPVSTTASTAGGTSAASSTAPPGTVAPTFGWKRAAPMGFPRAEMSGAAAGGVIVVPGGLMTDLGGATVVTDVVDIFDPATGEWSTAAPMPAPRHHIAVGGSRRSFRIANSGDVFVGG